MENNTFKGTLFGGFKREDVIDYIAKTSAASSERIAALEADVDKLLTEEKQLREALENAKAEKSALEAALAQAKEELSKLQSSYGGCENARAKLFDEVTTLRREVALLRPQAEEYGSVKSHIADIELLARQRAEALEYDTRVKVNALLDSCRAHYDDALAALSASCSKISGELYKANSSIGALPAELEKLRETLADLKIEE